MPEGVFGVFTLATAVGLIIWAFRADGPFTGQAAVNLALIGIPVVLFAVFLGGLSYALNYVVKYSISGVYVSSPIAALIFIFRGPVMILGLIGLCAVLSVAWSRLVKWELRAQGVNLPE